MRPSTCYLAECRCAGADRGRFRWPAADPAQSATAATQSPADYPGWNGSKRYAPPGHLSVLDCYRILTGIAVGGSGGRTAPAATPATRPPWAEMPAAR